MPEIVDLARRPEQLPAVADRIWRAWWRDAGYELSAVEALARESLTDQPIPSCVVAVDGEHFAGTASIIAHDMDERPNLTPWIAAVWVEPVYRGAGLGSRLVMEAARIGFDAGVPRIHLYTDPPNGPFYEKMGWALIEADVGRSDVFAMDRDAFSRRSARRSG